jgi:hypothetical protein
VASLVAGGAGLDPLSGYETQTTNLSAFLGPSDPYASATEYRYSDEVPAVYGAGDGHDTGAGYDAVDRSIGAGWDDASSDGTDRAEALRRTAARFTGNSGRARGTAPRRSDDDLNAPSPGPRSPERGYRKP